MFLGGTDTEDKFSPASRIIIRISPMFIVPLFLESAGTIVGKVAVIRKN